MTHFPTVAVDACALCHSLQPLRAESHIVPAFVFDYLIQSSGTGFMRAGPAPNLRVQDGFKQRLLCDQCEGLFSVWEADTAKLLFKPYHADTSALLPYGPWLAKFCASVCWRSLYVFQRLGLKNFSDTQKIRVGQALDAWNAMMRGEAVDPGEFEVHIVPVDEMTGGTSLGELPPNINRYLARVVEIDAAANPTSAFAYVKMCKLIVVGFIQMPNSGEWINTRVALDHGVIKPENRQVPRGFGRFVIDRAKNMAYVQSKISDRQKAKILETLLENPDRVAASESFRAISHDVFLFGRAAFDDGLDS